MVKKIIGALLLVFVALFVFCMLSTVHGILGATIILGSTGLFVLGSLGGVYLLDS